MTASEDAWSPEAPASERTNGQFVAFTCAGQAFGIDIMAVREIRSWSAVTPLPSAQDGLLGVLDIRGEVVPIWDLARRIGCVRPDPSQLAGQVILVVSLYGSDVGLVVDGVSDIVTVEPADIRPVPRFDAASAHMLSGMISAGERLVAILDPHEIFAQRRAEVEYAYLD